MSDMITCFFYYAYEISESGSVIF